MRIHGRNAHIYDPRLIRAAVAREAWTWKDRTVPQTLLFDYYPRACVKDLGNEDDQLRCLRRTRTVNQ
jgi:hypothetical protein